MRDFFNMDCLEGMKNYPDKYFDLAIVDPPYGDAGGYGQTRHDSGNDSTDTNPPHRNTRSHLLGNGGKWIGGGVQKTIIKWDVAPPQEYFDELFRVSKNQIIWGGNYFQLPPNRCFLIWRKTNVPHNFSMAMAEYGWTSFWGNAKVFDYSAIGQEGRFHPTQKPIALYKWLLTNYAKPGDIILDTHVGSASSLIACEELGFDYVGFEIDPEYYQKAKARIEEFNQQIRMF